MPVDPRMLLGQIVPGTTPEIPPEVAEYAQRAAPTNLPPPKPIDLEADALDEALRKDAEANRNGQVAHLISRGAALFRGDHVAPIQAPEINDSVKAFVMRRQMKQQDAADAAAKQKAGLDALKMQADLYKTGAEVGEIKARTGKTDAEAKLSQRKLEPASPALLGLAQRLGVKAPADATNADLMELIDPALKAQGLNLDWSKLGLERDRLAMDRDKAAREKGPKPQAVDELRKEFQGQQVVKDTYTLSAAYRKIMDSSATGAGDIGLIYGYMKMLDPNSTVREGEYATAESAGGVPSRVFTLYNKALRGEKLAPEVRSQFKSEAKRKFDSQIQNYKAVANNYRRLATQAGYSPADVVLDLGYEKEASPPAASSTGRPRRTDIDTGETREWDGQQWVPVGG